MKGYKVLAGKFFEQKVCAEFVNWNLVESNIATGEVLLSNEVADVELIYDDEDNTFALRSIKVQSSLRKVGAEELKKIYDSVVKDVML